MVSPQSSGTAVQILASRRELWPSVSYWLRFKRNAWTPYRPSPRSCTDVVPIQRTCFPIELTSMRKAHSADPIDTFEVIPILRKNSPLIYSPQRREVLQSTVTPACSGVPCLSPSGEVHGTTPAGRLDSPLSSLSSCGEADRTPPVGRPDSRAPNPSDKADRTTHPGPSDSSMSNSLSISSMLQIPTLDHEPTPLTSVPAMLPSGAAPTLTESVPVTRTSTKIRSVDHHFTLFLSTGSRPLMAPDPVMLANSGDLYLHQHHLNTQIWVKEASGWVIGRSAHPHPFLVDHRLHVVSPSQLHWVHKKTLVTYKGRDKRPFPPTT